MSFGFSLQRKCCFLSCELGSSALSPPAFHGLKKARNIWQYSISSTFCRRFTSQFCLLCYPFDFFLRLISQFCKSIWRSLSLVKSRLTKVCLTINFLKKSVMSLPIASPLGHLRLGQQSALTSRTQQSLLEELGDFLGCFRLLFSLLLASSVSVSISNR